MNFQKNQGARRKIAKIMEDSQKVEAAMAQQVRHLSLEHYRRHLKIVTLWLDSFKPDASIDPSERAIMDGFKNFSLTAWLEQRKKLAQTDAEIESAKQAEASAMAGVDRIPGSTVMGMRKPWASPEVRALHDSAARTRQMAKLKREEFQQQRAEIIVNLQKQCKVLLSEAAAKTTDLKQSPSIGPTIARCEAELAEKVADILQAYQTIQLKAISDAEKCLTCLRRRYTNIEQINARLKAVSPPRLPSGEDH